MADILELHAQHTGVLDVAPLLPVTNRTELGEAYTPGVAKLSKLVAADPKLARQYTISGKLVAVITDGSAVLGLGNIGPEGGLPVVEGKALLYKQLSGVTALPLAVDQVSVDECVTTIKNMAKSFAGIHLEDIAAPQCFAIEEQLKQALDIPVYHDDQEGTAIVVLAGLINAAKVVHKELTTLKVVVNGVGASGVATAKLLKAAGIHQVTLVDIHGVVKPDDTRYNSYQRELAADFPAVTGSTLDDVIADQDVFIGLSDAHVLSQEQVKKMATDPIIFALANPVPEILPEEAQAAGAKVMATGSSQYPNQVNNILAFPGLFRGLLTSGLKNVDLELEAAVAQGLATMVENPTADRIIPGVFDPQVAETVSAAVLAFAKNKEK